jgi:hypothetical protein
MRPLLASNGLDNPSTCGEKSPGKASLVVTTRRSDWPGVSTKNEELPDTVAPKTDCPESLTDAY